MESLEVCDCEQLVEILVEVPDEDQDQDAMSEDTFTFPKLMNLSLWNLPELKNFCYNKKAMASDPIQVISIHACPKLKRIPLLKEDHVLSQMIFVEQK